MAAGIVLAAVWLLVRRWGKEFQWGTFAASFTALDWRWVAAAAAVALATYWGRALRWSILLRPLRPRPNLWGLFAATAIGFTAIVLLGRPAELVRPYLISVRERVAFSSQLGAWFLERLADMLAMVVVFGLALSRMPAPGPELGTHLRWMLRAGGYLAAATAVALVVILVVVRQSPELVRTRLLEALSWLPPPKLRRVERMTAAFLEGLAAIQGRSGLIWLTVYTVLEWVLIAMCTLALFKAYPGTSQLGISEALVFMGLVGFGSLVQIPGLGGGVQIASVVVLRELYGLPIEVATSVAVGVWATTFVVILPVGLPLALHEGITFKRIKQLGAEAES